MTEPGPVAGDALSASRALPKIAVLVGPKGRGSNMIAIADACANDKVPAEVGLVIGGKEDAPALETARQRGLTTKVVASDETYSDNLLQILQGEQIDLICLAGYLRLLPPEVLHKYPNRVLNIHPALLPKFGGKGMYGRRVHEAVLAAGERESGCTVHYVNEVYDEGEIILQRRCPVLPDDTPETLAARVLQEEHKAWPEALNKVLGG